MVRELQNRKV